MSFYFHGDFFCYASIFYFYVAEFVSIFFDNFWVSYLQKRPMT